MPFPFPELHNNVSSHNYTYKLNQLLRELRDKEAQLGERHRGEMVRARARRDEAEAPLEDLELRQTGDLDTDQETELLESIKRSHELLEAERIFFEDLEVRQMEKEPSLEAEMHGGRWARCRGRGWRCGEELESMQGTREEFTRKPELEKEKLPDLET